MGEVHELEHSSLTWLYSSLEIKHWKYRILQSWRFLQPQWLINTAKEMFYSLLLKLFAPKFVGHCARVRDQSTANVTHVNAWVNVGSHQPQWRGMGRERGWFFCWMECPGLGSEMIKVSKERKGTNHGGGGNRRVLQKFLPGSSPASHKERLNSIPILMK